MLKAIHISSLIHFLVCIVASAVCIPMGFFLLNNMPTLVESIRSLYPSISESFLQAYCVYYLVLVFFLGFSSLLGVFFSLSFFRLSRSEFPLSKGKGILFGILAFLFSCDVLGVFLIIYGCRSRPKPADDVIDAE